MDGLIQAAAHKVDLLAHLHTKHGHTGILAHSHHPLLGQTVVADDHIQHVAAKGLFFPVTALFQTGQHSFADAAVGVDHHSGDCCAHLIDMQFSHSYSSMFVTLSAHGAPLVVL